MRVCNTCGIGISDKISVQYKNILYCKYCYKEYQQEQFKFWYENQPRKHYKHTCIICEKEFENSQPRSKVCSDQCRLVKKKLYERVRREKLRNECLRNTTRV